MLEQLNDRQRVMHLLLSGADVPDYIADKPAWMAEGDCHGQTDLFFPGLGQDAAAARSICAGCSVRDDCRAYAVREPLLRGIWGGTSEVERTQLRKAAA